MAERYERLLNGRRRKVKERVFCRRKNRDKVVFGFNVVFAQEAQLLLKLGLRKLDSIHHLILSP